MSATPLTVLYRLFWNFACVFFMVWECVCGLGIIVRTFFVTFPTLWTLSFFTSIYWQRVPLVSTTPLTVLYRSFWNFACVFFMVWRCACGLDIIVRWLFFVTFSALWTVIFHLNIKTVGTSCERNSSSSYSFIRIVLKLCMCFLHGMRMCMWFGYNC